MGNGRTEYGAHSPSRPRDCKRRAAFDDHCPATDGKVKAVTTREPGDRPCRDETYAVGCDGREMKIMTTLASVKTTSASLAQAAGSIMAVMAIGVTLMFVAGHAQSATLHDAAHDMRHATGFPCH